MARKTSGSFKLQPADPFDLIRWLARTQNDPRKAVAELVQNSIDAHAQRIEIARRRARGTTTLVIRDDGEGVLPDLPRAEALRYIATNIGRSRKRGLSPAERREQVIAGKYGIGLLGFWAIGGRLEIRSRVGGSPLSALKLVEDEQRAEIVRQPLQLDEPPTFTEVAVLDLHETALRALGGRRLADYLQAELRGAILQSGVAIRVHDGMARGLAQKDFSVVPKRFAGEKLNLPSEIAVEGFPPIQVELYFARGVDGAAIQVGCAGSLVADDLCELRSLGFDQPPWNGGELSGLFDFVGFTVPPGTRRGVAPNAAAAAFVEALEAFAPAVEAELSRFARERAVAVDRQVIQDLRRALRGFRNRLPQYEMPRIEEGPEGEEPAGRGVQVPIEAEEPEQPEEPQPDAQPELFPPGPLAAVCIVPERVEVESGSERRVRAVPTDGGARVLREGIAYRWWIEGDGFIVRGQGQRPALVAEPSLRVGAEATLHVEASQPPLCVAAAATIVCVVPAEVEPEGGLGIPKPELVDDPTGGWRSRYDGQTWQVNAAHEDYVALRSEGRARLRYLLSLLAKEIVQRTYGAPHTEPVLEHLVEVLAHAERNLRGA